MDFNQRILYSYEGNVPLPYYMAYPGYMSADRARNILKDLEYLQETYPVQVRRYQKKISDIIDRLDYDGSMIYDEYPDRLQLQRLAGSIYDMMRSDQKEENGKANNVMEEYGKANNVTKYNETENNATEYNVTENKVTENKVTENNAQELSAELIQVLMCNEIYRRRQKKCKYHNGIWCV